MVLSPNPLNAPVADSGGTNADPADQGLSREEVQCLLEFSRFLTTAQSPRAMDEISLRIGMLLPFASGLILHEARAPSGDVLLRFWLAAESSCTHHTVSAGCPSITEFLQSVDVGERHQSAFMWRARRRQSAQQADVQSVVAMGTGLAGLVGTEGEDARLCRTLLLLHDGDEQGNARQGELSAPKSLFVLNIAAFYLHLYFCEHAQGSAAGPHPARLTTRERAVMRWIAEGKTAWEVGKILSMTERTVKFHLRNIYSKLKVNNRAQAVTIASRLQLF
jgi:LuxR family transcriptional regulator, quorum-sensing system regulator SolR